MTVFLAKAHSLDIAYNGPMRSGVVIDSRTLLAQGYAACQAELAVRLGTQTGAGQEWYTPASALRVNNMQIDVDTKRGRTIIPGYVIGRLLTGDALTSLLRKHGLAATVALEDERQARGGAVLHVSSIDMRMYDMGYGSATFSGKITAKEDLSLEAYRDAAERLGSLLTRYRPLFLETFAKVAAALDAAHLVQNFLDGETGAFWPGSRLRHGLGDLFWVHRLFSVPCADAKDFAAAAAACKAFIASEQPELVDNVSIRAGIAVYPGNGNSAVIYDRTQVRVEDTATLASMVRAQNVFYVAAEDIDRDLFYLSNDLDRQKNSQDMSVLEKQSNTIVEYQSKVSFFKGVYDDFDNSLDPQALKIWHALEAAWQTRDRFENMNAKLDLVEKIYNRICENISRLQNKRLGTFMLAFTLISTLSVIVDTVDFTQGGALQAPSVLRIAVLCMMGFIVIFFAFTLLRQRK